MRIFHFTPVTRQLSCVDVADRDPLDASTWLIPAFATSVEPPESQEGKTLHFVDGTWVYQDIPAPVSEPVIAPLTGNALILSQIADAESTITPRRLREGALGTDNGWLKAKDAEITALRNLLVK